jgi:uncharacterized protein (DUF1800 family)
MRITTFLLFSLLYFSHAQAQVIFQNGFETPADFPANDGEAARFLLQATFGPTTAEIARVRQIGYSAWINGELAKPASLQKPYLDFVAGIPEPVYQNARLEAWYKNSITGSDQLRQRVAYALSQIFVTSDLSGQLNNEVYGMAIYYDLLATNAFGRYRDLLKNVTLSPTMGTYLSMLGNRKPNLALNIRPDENYAREIMQLFSIGLIKLNPDGTAQLSSGVPIPTYNNNTIRAFAHVFTGWTFGNCTEFEYCGPGYPLAIGARIPMRGFADFHHVEPDADPLNNVLLDGFVRPSGGTPEQNLDIALDNIANHPNVGPFIGRRLIQNLISSNPSPAYIARITAVFNNNGSGVRGDLAAVVKAILLDPEARTMGGNRGKLREPILREVALLRTFGGRSADDRYRLHNPEFPYGQAPGRANSVFNFYQPDYRLPGEITSLNLYSPEFQITTESTITMASNEYLSWAVIFHIGGWINPPPDRIFFDLRPAAALASNPGNMADYYNVLLMGGTMSPAMRTILVNFTNTVPLTAGNDSGGRVRAYEMLNLMMTSPEYSVLK